MSKRSQSADPNRIGGLLVRMQTSRRLNAFRRGRFIANEGDELAVIFADSTGGCVVQRYNDHAKGVQD